MVTSTRYETTDIDRAEVRFYDNDALMDLWQSKRNDTLTNAQRNRIAGASLDKAAQAIFAHLDSETSLKWDDLSQIADASWPDATRAVALLVWANLCQPGPTRIRLTETGISIINKPGDSIVD